MLAGIPPQEASWWPKSGAQRHGAGWQFTFCATHREAFFAAVAVISGRQEDLKFRMPFDFAGTPRARPSSGLLQIIARAQAFPGLTIEPVEGGAECKGDIVIS